MKKLLIASFLICFALTSFGQGIGGTAHDLSGETWNASGEICIVCHTPHNKITDAELDGPLWNHASTALTGFTPYTSPTGTLNATDVGQPALASRLCLSCHDGTVAVSSFGGATGTVFAANPFTLDLSGHHPVSFTYDNSLATADGGLHAPTTTDSGLGAQIDDDLLFGGDQMECASCHDVHDAYGNTTLLVIDNASSALCLTCHDK